MATTKVYAGAVLSVFNKEIDYDTDDIRAMLTTATYVPNLDTHRYKSSITNEVAGTGYTAGGVALTAKTITYTAANSWATTWVASTAKAVGDIIRPATGNGFLYKAVVAGTTAATAPTFPTTVGTTVTDGGVTWLNIGTGVVVLDANDPAWAAATISAIRYMVIYDNTPATDATRPLLALVDFVTDQAVTSGTFTAVLGVNGIMHLPVQ